MPLRGEENSTSYTSLPHPSTTSIAPTGRAGLGHQQEAVAAPSPSEQGSGQLGHLR